MRFWNSFFLLLGILRDNISQSPAMFLRRLKGFLNVYWRTGLKALAGPSDEQVTAHHSMCCWKHVHCLQQVFLLHIWQCLHFVTCILVIVSRKAAFPGCTWRRKNRPLMSSVHKSKFVRIRCLHWNVANILYFPLVYWERAGFTRFFFNNGEKNRCFHSWGWY